MSSSVLQQSLRILRVMESRLLADSVNGGQKKSTVLQECRSITGAVLDATG